MCRHCTSLVPGRHCPQILSRELPGAFDRGEGRHDATAADRPQLCSLLVLDARRPWSYRPDMAGPVRSLEDLSGKGADLVVACCACGHDRTVAIEQVMLIFRRRQWQTDWRLAHARFRCRNCGSKDVRLDADFYGFALRRQRRPATLTAVPETLRPGLHPPPPGVALSVWNRASERERRRLVERSRS